MEQEKENATVLARVEELLDEPSFRTLISEALDSTMQFADLLPYSRSLGLDIDLYGAFVESVELITNLSVDSIYMTTDNRALVTLTAQLEVVADLALSPAEASLLEDHPTVTITNFGLGTSTAHGVVTLTGEGEFDIRIVPETGAVESASLQMLNLSN